MSQVFFDQLGLAEPKHRLANATGGHGSQTAVMLEGIERVSLQEKPRAMLVYGDSNSTLAGALVGAKLLVPVIHVEAGLRSFDRRMPEEINRVITDRISSLLFCPSEVAAQNLRNEGITTPAHVVGDVMLDVLKQIGGRASLSDGFLGARGLTDGAYILATIHRAENTDDRERLSAIVHGLRSIAATMPVLFPVHPRTAKQIARFGLDLDPVRAVEPLGYLEMAGALAHCRRVITDSGGLQKEAHFCRKPCVTVRDSTEWVETLEGGWNVLAPPDAETLRRLAFSHEPSQAWSPLYGDGAAAEAIVSHTIEFLRQ